MAGELVWVGGMSRTGSWALSSDQETCWGGGEGGGATPVGFRFIRFFSWGGLSGSVEGGSYANRPQIYLWFFHLPSEQLLGGEGGGLESWRREQSQQSLYVSWVFSSAS